MFVYVLVVMRKEEKNSMRYFHIRFHYGSKAIIKSREKKENVGKRDKAVTIEEMHCL